ncbi:MAG: hypothetical protein JSW50_00160 [Candidatus Latescibacterota bacterium]|nr:MAG: hypothetical protein JSW50_00160 [Candidatus Latescibacterota bacterium]
MDRQHVESPPKIDPGNAIANQRVKVLYDNFLDAVCGIHEEVNLSTTRVELRILFRNALLCRVVPYRDIIHVQVGDKNPWEIRIRNEESCVDTLDRVLARFFDIYSSSEHR